MPASPRQSSGRAAACPGTLPRTPVQRLSTLAWRLHLIRQAVNLLHTPVQKFEAALTDEQRTRLEQQGTPARPADLSGCNSDIGRMTGVATQTIQQIVQPTDEQRMGFGMVMGTASRMGEMLKECPAERPATPTARLDAAKKRLSAMLYATQNIRVALHRFYISLSDEQKARLDAAGDRHEQAAR